MSSNPDLELHALQVEYWKLGPDMAYMAINSDLYRAIRPHVLKLQIESYAEGVLARWVEHLLIRHVDKALVYGRVRELWTLHQEGPGLLVADLSSRDDDLVMLKTLQYLLKMSKQTGWDAFSELRQNLAP